MECWKPLTVWGERPCVSKRDYRKVAFWTAEGLSGLHPSRVAQWGIGGNMYIDLLCQSWDRASTASARGSVTGDMNWSRRLLWTVANISTSGVPQNWKIRLTVSEFRRPCTLSESADWVWIGGPLPRSSILECVWLWELCPEPAAT